MINIDAVLNEYTTFELAVIKKDIDRILAEKKEKNRTKKVYETLLSCIDLTSLNSTDTEETIAEFTEKVNTFEDHFPELSNVAAICVYPSMVATVKDLLTEDVEIASVAGGFPHAQTFLEIKVAETALAVMEGASEIDIVLSLGKLLEKKYEDLIDELTEIKAACRDAHLKVILESGALSLEDLRIATILSLESGVQFIKTSTGKQQPAATTTAAYVMCKLIGEFNQKRGVKIGFKAAGGISTCEDALDYYTIVEAVLGEEWLNKNLFRFGASKLANDLLSKIEDKTINYF